MLLTIATRTCDPDILVFELAGRISLGRESSHLEDTVLKAIADGHHKIVVDISGVHHIDSSGIGIFALCFGKISSVGGKFCVAGAKGIVEKIFHMTHLDSVIPFAATVDDACKGMQ